LTQKRKELLPLSEDQPFNVSEDSIVELWSKTEEENTKEGWW